MQLSTRKDLNKEHIDLTNLMIYDDSKFTSVMNLIAVGTTQKPYWACNIFE